jgi:hypothetical protein
MESSLGGQALDQNTQAHDFVVFRILYGMSFLSAGYGIFGS